MRSSSTITAGALLGALLTAALTGCTTGGTDEPTSPPASQTATAEPTTTPTVTPTPTPTVPQAGDVIDVADRDTVPDGLLTYLLGGRDYMVLDPAAPLPQVIVDDLTARAAADEGSGMAMYLVQDLVEDTGKDLVLIEQSYGSFAEDESGNYYDIWTCYTADGFITQGHLTEAAAVAEAAAFVAAQPNPDQWTIIDP